jgi:hypothetical protein
MRSFFSTTRGVHEFYLSLIAIGLIVGLASVQWYAIPKLEELFSFALTVSSLLLALVAIIYSLYSNASVENAVSSLSAAVAAVPGVANRLDASASRLASDVGTLTQLTDGLAAKMQTHHDELRSELRVVGSRLAAERTAPPEAAAEVPSVPKVNMDEIVSRVISRTSTLGHRCLLAISHTGKQDAPLVLKQVFQESQVEYVYGYLIALNSVGVYQGTVDGVTLVVRASDIDYQEVRTAALARINRTSKDNPEQLERRLATFQKFEDALQAPEGGPEAPSE